MDVILKTLSVVLTLIEQSQQQTCLQFGIRPGRLQGREIGIFSHGDAIACMRECLIRRKCEGMTVEPYTCMIYSNISSASYWKGNFYSRVSDLPKDTMGTCATRPCGMNEKCIPTAPVHTCIVWCHLPDYTFIAVQNDLTGGAPPHFKTWAEYSPTKTHRSITCLEDGSWSYTKDCCKKIRNCRQLKTCSAGYPDRKYRMHAASGDTEVEVFCSNMTSDTPSTETLDGHTRSFSPLFCDRYTPAY